MINTIVGTERTDNRIVVNAATGEVERFISFEQRAKELKEQEAFEAQQKKNEKKNGYTNFYQVNRKYSGSLEKLIKENHAAALLFQFLLNHMDGYNAVVCSYSVIKEALDISTSTTLRCINYLRNNGYIDVGKSGTTNVYIVNPELAWSSWGNNKKYCKFSANIILSATENQDLIIKSMKEKKLQINKKEK